MPDCIQLIKKGGDKDTKVPCIELSLKNPIKDIKVPCIQLIKVDSKDIDPNCTNITEFTYTQDILSPTGVNSTIDFYLNNNSIPINVSQTYEDPPSVETGTRIYKLIIDIPSLQCRFELKTFVYYDIILGIIYEQEASIEVFKNGISQSNTLIDSTYDNSNMEHTIGVKDNIITIESNYFIFSESFSCDTITLNNGNIKIIDNTICIT